MAYDTIKSTAAVASIINAASDESKMRDFLVKELTSFSHYDWQVPSSINATLVKLFNTEAPKAPRGSQELLDAFKAGAFTVDQAKVDKNTKYVTQDWDASPYDEDDEDDSDIGEKYYGITFTGMPVADLDGYGKAREEFFAARKDALRTIMIGTPTEGLAALKALESWKTTVIPATTPTPVAA